VTRTICAITSSRADYGIQSYLYQQIAADADFTLKLLVTGTHLSEKYGNTRDEITDDGLEITACVDLAPVSTTASDIARAFGDGVTRFTAYLSGHRPDMVIVLGDRYEIFAVTIAAYMLRIPVVHLHGGETTEGAYDEAFRHAISKMSHLHLVAAEDYRRRVIQLGEHPDTVFNVGSLAVNNMKHMTLLDKQAIGSRLGRSLWDKNLLVTFHPETLGSDKSDDQMRELLAALDERDDTLLIFTSPNADTGADTLVALLEDFVDSHSNACLHASLGQLLYFSVLQYVDGVVGNSSSGLIEVPSFKTGTVNIGDRQKGRIKAATVIDCPAQRKAIGAALDMLYSPEFRRCVAESTNPYEQDDTVTAILNILKSHPDFNLKKPFYDINFDMRNTR
jgi:GDP/UDP-N,N'-diacetylbacillosamine 2-epimerase (hydrolysing)